MRLTENTPLSYQPGFTGGTLQVGTFQGDLLNGGGTLAPGSSAGTTTVQGDYAQEQLGTLAIEIGGTIPGTEHDQLNAAGTASLAVARPPAVTRRKTPDLRLP